MVRIKSLPARVVKLLEMLREKLELETGDKVVSEENYLAEAESRRRIKRK